MIRNTVRVASWVVVAMMAQTVMGADWPQWLGPQRDGVWRDVEWPVALEFVAAELKRIKAAHGAAAIGALATPHQTLEELHLLQKMVRGLGSGNVDFRLRHADFSVDGKRAGIPWLGMSIADFAQLDRASRDRVVKLAALLRFADGMDRGHVAAVGALRLKLANDALRVTVVEAEGATTVRLECWGASRKRHLLEELLGRPIVVIAPDGTEISADDDGDGE